MAKNAGPAFAYGAFFAMLFSIRVSRGGKV
jgi:hypothetical protein